MINLTEYRASNTAYSDYLPFVCMPDPATVLCKNQFFIRTVLVKGHDYTGRSDDDILRIQAVFNEALKRLGENWYCLYETRKRAVGEYRRGSFPDPVTQRLDDLRWQDAEDYSFFAIDKYITVGYQAGTSGVGLVNKHLYRQKPEESIENEYRYFIAECRNIFNIFTNCFSEVILLQEDDLLSYYNYTTTLKDQVVAMPEIPFGLDVFLASSIPQGSCPLEIDGKFVYAGSIVDFPVQSRLAMMDEVAELPFEFRWVTRFIPLGAEQGLKYMKKTREIYYSRASGGFGGFLKRMFGNKEVRQNVEELAKLEGVDQALDVVGKEQATFGYFTTTFLVWDKDEEVARLKLQEIKRVIEQEGIVVKLEDFNTYQAFLGCIPGQVYANIRKPVLNSVNFSHLVQLSSVWNGERVNPFMAKVCGDGSPLLLATTAGGTPFYLNLHVGDVGHSIILGPTGSGKSTLIAMLAASWMRYPGAGVVLFDKGRSAKHLTSAVGGKYYEPYTLDEEGGIRFQPLNINTKEDASWAAEWIKDLVTVNGIKVTVEMAREIKDAVGRVLETEEVRQKTMSYLSSLMQDPQVKEVLAMYCDGGEYGRIFDGDREDVEYGRWVDFEMGSLLNSKRDELILPVLSYLFHLVERGFDGRPCLVIIDEGWQVFRNELFVNRVMEWLRTLRKLNCSVIFATQEISQVDELKGAIDTLVNACKTTIFLPNPAAGRMRDIYHKFGLSDSEIDMLADSVRVREKRDYFIKSALGERVFNLDLTDEQLEILRGE